MTTISKIFNIGGAVGAALIVSSLSLGQASAYACKGTQYSGSATKSYRFAAKRGARTSWKNSVQNQVGLSWSLWSIAATKSVSCNKTGSQHTCQALARPCQYVVQ
jgi:hypothetical protein